MERIVDKSIILVCCVAALFLIQQSTVFIVGLLLVLTVSSLQEIVRLPEGIKALGLGLYLVAALIFPVFAVFIPLIAYDCLQLENAIFKLSWLAPLLIAFRELDLVVLAFLAIVALISCSLSWRTGRILAERQSHMELRDAMRELSLALEQKNRDLQEKRDLEVRFATLAERGRIAREIHDNVGHLLTRSVLQIEAAQVVHAHDAALKAELEQVGATLHEAFDTVRASVHDLHDDSFDLYTQLYAIARSSPLELSFDYQVEAMPDGTAYTIVAMVREAVANAAKHSDANQVKVSLVEYPAFWQLVVHDNGSVDPFRTSEAGLRILHTEGQKKSRFALDFELAGETRGAEGIGLKTMEERTRNLGGVFRIDYDRGFRVFVSIPKS